jgi:hypothetical protein
VIAGRRPSTRVEADFGAGSATEIEAARIEREAWADPETLGLSLKERLTQDKVGRIRL